MGSASADCDCTADAKTSADARSVPKDTIDTQALGWAESAELSPVEAELAIVVSIMTSTG